jgi:signal transduction histidine kinase/ligand-binding sensor domain-containing protein
MKTATRIDAPRSAKGLAARAVNTLWRVWLRRGLPLFTGAGVVCGWFACACLLAPLAWSATTADEFSFADLNFETIGDADTLSSPTITALAQDKSGMIWIGMQGGGLVRHDGYRFRLFQHTLADARSLAGNYVNALTVGVDGSLWIGTFGSGLSRYRPETEQFDNFLHDPKQPESFNGGQIWALTGDSQGGLWIATHQGLDYCPAACPRFTHYRHDPARSDSLLDDRVRSLLYDRQGRMWVGSAGGLQRLRPDGKGWDRIDLHAVGNAVVDVRSLFQAQDNKIWLGSFKHGAAWLDADSLQVHWLPLADGLEGRGLSYPWIKSIAQATPEQIWLGSMGGGINVVAAGDGRMVQQVRHDGTQPDGLILDHVGSLLQDQSGLLWVGTWGKGVQRFNARNQAFRMVRHNPGKVTGLSNPDVYCVLELADGRILTGSPNGIDILDRQRGLIGGYRKQGGPRQGGPRQGGPLPNLPDGSVNALAQTPDGTLWAGTQLAGVVRLPPGASAWQSSAGLPGIQARRLLVGQDGELWAISSGGLARWHAAQQRFVTIAAQGESKLLENLFTLTQDRDKRLWLASSLGLWVLEPGEDKLTPIRHDPQFADSLPVGSVGGLLVDQKGHLWVSTMGGLERLQSWNGKRAVFEHISSRVGRPGAALGDSLLEDRRGRIWTGSGMLDPASMQYVEFGRADGLWGSPSHNSFTATRDGLMLYGSADGLAVVQPDRFHSWDFLPPVVITELKINGRHTPFSASALTLMPGQRTITVEFAALDYSLPKQNRYRYRLQGYDQDWIETDFEHRSASYGNLSPGNYVLEIAGSNRVGMFNPTPLALQVRVLPAWWQTIWFRVLAGVVLGALLLLGYRARLSHLQQKARQLQQMIDARTADILELGEIGQELTATLDTEQAFSRVFQHVVARLPVDVFMINLYQPEQQQVRIAYALEDGQPVPGLAYAMHEVNRPAVWCVRERRELICQQRADLRNYIGTILAPRVGQPMETIVYLPLLLGEQVIGCLSVQSRRRNAYNSSQLEFLRVLASYTAIAVSNTAAHAELSQSHDELASAHQHLQQTQAQLIQSEKLASLGQLVANVAHEINTPIGAVKASGDNINDALEQMLDNLPRLFKMLGEGDAQLFRQLIRNAKTNSEVFSSREERTIRRALATQLAAAGIEHGEQKAIVLLALRAHDALDDYWPLLRHPEVDFILENAREIAAIINNTANINLAVARVSKIVYALRAFARDRADGKRELAQLRDGLETVLLIYQNRIKQGIELVRDYHEIAPLLCWPDDLNQVWTNLIHNALQAMAGKGILTIRITQQDGAAVVAISDTGCGIPAQLRERIFDAFFTTRAVGEGSGLGLDVVKKIIERHAGRIDLQSEEGVGTTFSVYLPYQTEP